MKRKNIAAAVTAVLLSVGLGGCGKNAIPSLTEEETRAVGEYVAFTVIKYDANHRSRLVGVEYLEESGPEETPSPETSAAPEPTREPQGMGPTDDTPVKDSSSAVNTHTMEEVVGLPAGFALVYAGQSVCTSYPEGGSSDFFTLDAGEGKAFLVLKFALANQSGEEQSADVLSSGAVFQVTVNESYTRRALTTMLYDDLSTFVGSVPADGRADTVILIEMEQERASDITSVSLNVKNGEKTHTIKLL